MINIALASGGFVTSISLFWQLVSSANLRTILEKEIGFDITALYLGVLAAGWVSLQPIAQIFQASSFKGIVEDCEVYNGKILHYRLSCNNQIYQVVVREDVFNQLTLRNRIRSVIQQPDDLIGRNVIIKDISPISIGRNRELRVNEVQQIVIS
ncbi:hypothetical protein WA1_49480 [Scytonema hofmannii PCC 7110]|uniref:Uncharacterized protein n=1 Tax=Scytonema hofmannii PCC 7110 TaxID=128403 RepID=A0A139WQS0_9CYAN|nr:hypothetical protein WA1_49480 [Scytonema hofmannii PCC 7110]